MKTMKLLMASLCFTILLLNAQNQSVVKDIKDLGFIPENAVPDVYGKILISGEFDEISVSEEINNGIEIMEGWPAYGNGEAQRGGIYCNLDEDQELEIVYCIGNKTYAWNYKGTLLPGWPQEVELYPSGAPAFGDVDGDGEGEIVVSSRQVPYSNEGWLYAFESDGTITNGFPVYLNGGAVKTPVLADLDGDDAMEIIVTESNYPNGYLTVYRGDGSIYPGFPFNFGGLPGSAVAVGDITGDDIPEIVAESYLSIYVLDNNGNVLDGFPYTPGNDRVFSYSSPVLADLDGDGLREIIFGDHQTSGSMNGAVHILKNDGSLLPGWPKYTTHWVYGPPAIGDIDGDGSLDIAVGDQTASSSPFNKVYVWDVNGNYLPGWPTSPVMAINNQIIIADLDGDYEVELIWDDNTSSAIYLGYNHDGTVMDGWPLEIQWSTFFINPFVVDIDNDGITNFSGGGVDIWGSLDCEIYLWSTGTEYHPELNYVPILQYDLQHSGVYRDPQATNIDDITDEADFSVYPNPATNYLHIKSDIPVRELNLYNQTGQLQLKQYYHANQLEVNISQYGPGLYLLRIDTEKGIWSKKVVIQ